MQIVMVEFVAVMKGSNLSLGQTVNLPVRTQPNARIMQSVSVVYVIVSQGFIPRQSVVLAVFPSAALIGIVMRTSFVMKIVNAHANQAIRSSRPLQRVVA